MRDSAGLIAIAVLATACSATNAGDAGIRTDGARETMDAQPASEDAWVCDDWVIWGCPPPPPEQPSHFAPPTVPCDTDTNVGDPCARWVDCAPLDVDANYPWGAWAVTWLGGSCVSGTCVFTSDPTAQYCYAGCSLHTGMYGRCTNPGPTAP